MASVTPTISVFIVHWNRPSELIVSLHSLAQQTNCNLQIVVFDNHSTKENLDKLKSALPISVSLIEGEDNFGWGKALNQMLKPWLADDNSEFCLISAHDALLSPACVETLLAAMQANDQIGIASPDHDKHSLKTTYSPLRGAKTTKNTNTSNALEDACYAHGTLFMLRRKCLQEIGLFDERFFAYGDEVDLSLRARENNWRVAICHQAKITNPISGTNRPALFYLDARNSILLAELHGNKVLALLRALIIYIRSSIAICVGNDKEGIEKAKLIGVQSYLAGKWGPPPTNFSLLQEKPIALTEGDHD